MPSFGQTGSMEKCGVDTLALELQRSAVKAGQQFVSRTQISLLGAPIGAQV